MRSLARDIRAGLKISKYQCKVNISDGHGGNCAMGTALLGAGEADADLRLQHEVGLYKKHYPKYCEPNLKNGASLVCMVIGSNDHFARQHSREVIADITEAFEWEHFGIPTQAMKDELGITEPVKEATIKEKEVINPVNAAVVL